MYTFKHTLKATILILDWHFQAVQNWTDTFRYTCERNCFLFKWMDQHSFRLIAQMQTQKWDKPFSYQLGRSAFSQIYLKKFTWAYTQERKHFCVKCVLAFSDSSKLKSHKQIHTREKPCCEVCQSTFSQKSNLKVNLQRHKGEKPHSCSVCVCVNRLFLWDQV